MNTRALRAGLAAGLLAFVLLFFVPILPFTQVVKPFCGPPGPGGFTSCGPVPDGGSSSGYQSIGHLTIGWGAIYSGWLGGYVPPSITYDLGDGIQTLTGFEVLLAVVLPVAIACAWLFSPELVGFSRASRIVFFGFGAALFLLSDLLLISMGMSGGFPRIGVLFTVFFCSSGVLMMLHAMHVWPLGVWEREDHHALG